MHFEISVILTLHDEGRIAYRTFNSIERAMSFAIKRGVAVEIVIVMDKVHDPILKKVVNEWKINFNGNAFSFPVDFGALSLSRNFGVEKSHGEFIAILDGDDLFCENWIFEAYKICSVNPEYIAHPEATYYFPFERFVRFSNGSPEAIINLLIYNQWTALTFAHRKIFCENKYIKDIPPYAYQDWLWNCLTASKGFRHVIIPGTILAIRQKPFGKSLWQNTHSQNKIVRPNIHFRNIFLRKYDDQFKCFPHERKFQWHNALWEKVMKYFVDYYYTKNPKVYSVLLKLRRFILEKIRSFGKATRLPVRLTSELEKISRIDPAVKIPGNIDIRRPVKPNRIRSAVIPEMSKLVGTNKAKVFIFNSITRDNITLNALNYVNAQENTFLITTEKLEPFSTELIPENTTLIPIGNSGLFSEERLQLLLRLLHETDTEWVHIINSRIAYIMINNYKKTFIGKKVFTTLLDPCLANNDFGWELMEYSDLLDTFSNISTDTDSYKSEIQKVYGIPQTSITEINFSYDPELYTHFYQLKKTAKQMSLRQSKENTVLRIFVAGLPKYKKNSKRFVASLSNQISRKKKIEITIWDFERGRIKDSDFSVFDFDISICYNYFPGMYSLFIQILGTGAPVLIKDEINMPKLFTDETGWFFNGSAKEAGEIINQLLKKESLLKIKQFSAKKYIREHFRKNNVSQQIAEFYNM